VGHVIIFIETTYIIVVQGFDMCNYWNSCLYQELEYYSFLSKNRAGTVSSDY
jgi:hypothetical protein